MAMRETFRLKPLLWIVLLGALCIFPLIGVSAQEPDYVGYWRFDDNAGITATDSSGHGNNGTLVNGPVWVLGEVNSAIKFDGINDAVRFNSANQDRVSIAAWVTTTSRGASTFPRIVETPGWRVFFGRAGGATSTENVGFAANWATAGEWRTPANSIRDSPEAMPIWYHIVVTYDGSVASNSPSIYINGVKQTVTGTPPSGSKTPNFGTGTIGNSANTDRPWAGKIDELRIFSKVLSDAEVLAMFNGGADGPPGAPHNLRLSEGTTTTTTLLGSITTVTSSTTTVPGTSTTTSLSTTTTVATTTTSVPATTTSVAITTTTTVSTTTISASPLRLSFAGDWDSVADTRANLRNARDNSDLLIMIGDLKYGTSESLAEWCQMVKDNIGNVPVLVLPGDHDSLTDAGADMRQLLQCLPLKPGPTIASPPVGNYPYKYYVDLRGGTRLITTGMGLLSAIPEGLPETRDWNEGQPNYNWLADTIDDARERGINNIIVANHESCFDVANKNPSRDRSYCTDVLNLLMAKKVDILFTASRHVYYRSKSLAHSPTCPKLMLPGEDEQHTPSPTCARDATGGSTYTKGLGTLLLAVGTGGADSYDCSGVTSDKEIPLVYMNTCSANHGIMLLEINGSSITGRYKRASNGAIQDSFTIGN